MARECDLCGKKTASGYTIKRRGLAKKKGGVGKRITGRTRRKFKPNIQRVRAKINNIVKRIKVCTRCISAGKVKKAA